MWTVCSFMFCFQRCCGTSFTSSTSVIFILWSQNAWLEKYLWRRSSKQRVKTSCGCGDAMFMSRQQNGKDGNFFTNITESRELYFGWHLGWVAEWTAGQLSIWSVVRVLKCVSCGMGIVSRLWSRLVKATFLMNVACFHPTTQHLMPNVVFFRVFF